MSFDPSRPSLLHENPNYIPSHLSGPHCTLSDNEPFQILEKGQKLCIIKLSVMNLSLNVSGGIQNNNKYRIKVLKPSLTHTRVDTCILEYTQLECCSAWRQEYLSCSFVLQPISWHICCETRYTPSINGLHMNSINFATWNTSRWSLSFLSETIYPLDCNQTVINCADVEKSCIKECKDQRWQEQ